MSDRKTNREFQESKQACSSRQPIKRVGARSAPRALDLDTPTSTPPKLFGGLFISMPLPLVGRRPDHDRFFKSWSSWHGGLPIAFSPKHLPPIRVLFGLCRIKHDVVIVGRVELRVFGSVAMSAQAGCRRYPCARATCDGDT